VQVRRYNSCCCLLHKQTWLQAETACDRACLGVNPAELHWDRSADGEQLTVSAPSHCSMYGMSQIILIAKASSSLQTSNYTCSLGRLLSGPVPNEGSAATLRA
jgi:hypothetical protein